MILMVTGLLLAGSFLVMNLYQSTFAQDDDTIEYAEDREDAVATFTTSDPEGDSHQWMALTGTDSLLFDFDDGVLSFKDQPDYEMPGDVAGTGDSTAVASDNVYEVTVAAIDANGNRETQEVKVRVTNVEEAGEVTLDLGTIGNVEDGVEGIAPYPGTKLTATLEDEDVVVTDSQEWQWSRSRSKGGSFTPIAEADDASYTPTQNDVTYYLRASVAYDDDEGEGKSQMSEPSEYAVQSIKQPNSPPVFPDEDGTITGSQAARSVEEGSREGRNVGAPVEATDADGDVLTYSLDETAADTFDIDTADGQIKTKKDATLNADLGGTTTYTATVTATDTGGQSATSTVTITVTEVDEPPAVTAASNSSDEPSFEENTATTEAVGTYEADDPETNANPTFTLMGADSGKFVIGNGGSLPDFNSGELRFRGSDSPNYENPGDADGDNVYEVTVVATDANRNRGTLDVKVTVTNDDESGTVTLSEVQPRVGVPVKASLTDPDGGVFGVMWVWTLSSGDPAGKGAMTDTYTPHADDADETLTATATYRDASDVSMDTDPATATSSNAVALDTRNKAPEFTDEDEDTAGLQAKRKVDENTAAVATDDNIATDTASDNVGDPVTATDTKSDGTPETLVYSLSGPDSASFRVRQDNPATTDADEGGQIEVASGTELDYETKDTYMVIVTARDSFGVSTSIEVTITVNEVNEGPEISGTADPDYAEDREDAVATFTTSDPEGDSHQWMALTGADSLLFDFDDGVLSFKDQPDYEMPGDVAGTGDSTAVASDNVYEVTVAAIDANGNRETQEVKVRVTNVEEAGEVTLDLGTIGNVEDGVEGIAPYPGTKLTATLEDEDVVVTDSQEWQWSRSRSKGGSFTPIAEADDASYTPTQNDVTYYLRASVAYDDDEGEGKSQMSEPSEYAVQSIKQPNSPPVFPDEDGTITGSQAARSVEEGSREGRNVGAPVEATDADGDVLTYSLDETAADTFDIDTADGQIKTKKDATLNADLGGTTTYTATVTATDTGGQSATSTVTITVTEVDEPPAVTAASNSSDEPSFEENTATTEAVGTYEADDPETNANPTFTLMGADSGKFVIGNGGSLPDFNSGELRFRGSDSPNYENPGDADGDNVYEVTVVATDANRNRGTLDVKVTVTNDDESGTVTLSEVQPRVGVPVKASLTDPDGGVFGVMWVWTLSSGDPAGKGAMTDTYTPHADDADETLTATATYRDASDVSMDTDPATATSSNAVALDTRNKAPEFTDEDEDTAGLQAKRKVDENTAAVATDDNIATDTASDNVGDPVTATDTKADGTPETLVYSLSGPDSASFRVRQDNPATTDADEGGQIEVASGTELDYETKDTYMVIVTARDSFGVSTSIEVTITVNEVNEPPEIMQGGLVISGVSTVDYAEDRRDPVATYTASGPDADSATWTLGGDDAGDFRIGSSSGELTFVGAHDYENAADADMDNDYMVTIMADDGTYMAMREVTVTVTNVDEAGEVTLSTMRPQVGVELTAELMDLDGGVTGVEWQWARSSDMSTWADIEGATSASYMPVDGDANMYLRATAMYTDGHGPDKSKMAVSAQQVTANTAPEFPTATAERSVAENTAAGMAIGAPVAATDADNDTLAYTLGGTDMASFDIDPATGQLMTMAALDFETKTSYSVTVTASDDEEEASVMVTIMVTNVGLDNAYDVDDDGVISRAEAVNAVADFFDGLISREDALAVVAAFFG